MGGHTVRFSSTLPRFCGFARPCRVMAGGRRNQDAPVQLVESLLKKSYDGRLSLLFSQSDLKFDGLEVELAGHRKSGFAGLGRRVVEVSEPGQAEGEVLRPGWRWSVS